MGHQPKQIYEFGPHRLDAAERLLLRDGEVVPLQPKVFDLLLALVERHGRLLEKDELMKVVWPDAIVEEANLANNISILRKTLSENGQQFIGTVPKRGYRFVAPVNELTDGSVEPVVVERPQTQIAVATRQEIDPDDQPDAPDSVRPRRWRGALTSRLLLALAALIVAGGGFWVARMARQSGASAGKMPRSIAVLPFKPLAPNNRDEVMELGMADALITKLSSLNQIIVRPTSAIRKYTALDQDPIAAGREQEVEAVLDASYQRTGEKIRVTVRLMDVRSGFARWIYKCDEYCNDLFTAQDIISENVAGAMIRDLTGEERKRLTKHYTNNIAAHQLYITGRYFRDKWTRDATWKAVESFQQAIALDPNYALAYAGLADCYMIIGNFWGPEREMFPKAKAAAAKALALDESLSEAHTSLAVVAHLYDWDWAGSEKEFKRALELDPNNAFAHHSLGNYLLSMGRIDEALAAGRRAIELDPTSLRINSIQGWRMFYARRTKQAIEQLRKTLEMDPNYNYAHSILANTYELDGMYEECANEHIQNERLGGTSPEKINALKQAYTATGWKGFWRKKLVQMLEKSDRQPGFQMNLAFVYERLGEKDRALACLNKAYEESDWQPGFQKDLAIVYARLGEKDRALACLNKAYEEHDTWLIWIKVAPFYDTLRSDPRFTELVRKVGLPL
jgi:DNA-binding winged helix-turn-helix (wHTH) protein/tetratricopeptide (TPR) repeat protein